MGLLAAFAAGFVLRPLLVSALLRAGERIAIHVTRGEDWL